MSEYEAVLKFFRKCPLVGDKLYFNFIDETDNRGNTSLITTPYPTPVRTYIDGGCLYRLQFELRYTLPLSKDSNTTANAEALARVQELLDWLNEQGKSKNYPDLGTDCKVQFMGTTRGVNTPSVVGVNDGTTLFAFPFEIHFLKNKR